MFGYANEFQAAYDKARMEYHCEDDKAKIKALVADGKAVIYHSADIHCPYTDAIMNVEHHIKEVFDSVEDARAAMDAILEEDEFAAQYLELDYKEEAPAPVGVEGAPDEAPF